MSLHDLYRHLWAALEPGELAEIDDVPAPRGPDWIFGLTDEIGLKTSARVLDLGCGPGDQARALADRYRARVVAIDPVVEQLHHARAAAGSRPVLVMAGTMESIPAAAASIDLIWLRDALMHSNDPGSTFRECSRVLRPGGHLLLHTAYATARLAAHELELLEADMSVSRASLDVARVDAEISAAGLEIVRREVLGSELAEHYELADGLGGRALVRLARLERHPELLLDRLGPEGFRAARGLYHWVVFELMGKLSYRTSLLHKPG